MNEEPQSKYLMYIDGICKTFTVPKGWFRKESFNAVNHVTLGIEQGKVYGLVGESGCGKSTLASAVLMLNPPDSGSVYYKGEKLDYKRAAKNKALRRDLQLIFQDPYSSIDPKMRVRDIIAEPMRVHKICPPAEIDARVEELIEKVGLSAQVLDRYPHEFSGGQRQRISIARVLSMSPSLIIADESTAALDVSVQAQILNLLRKLQQELGLTMIFISHDLNVIRHISDEIIVMHMGDIVERGNTETVYNDPKHPYTESLLSAAPNPDPFQRKTRIRLEGDPPSLTNLPSGCPMHPRCRRCMDICRSVKPELRSVSECQMAACHLYDPAN